MDDDAGRLVDDEQVPVLPHDGDVHLHGLEPHRLRKLRRDLLATRQPEALRPRLTVHEDGA